MKTTTWIMMIIFIPIIVFMVHLIFWVDLFSTGIEGNELFLLGLSGVNIGIVLSVYLVVYRWNKIFEDHKKDKGEKQEEGSQKLV